MDKTNNTIKLTDLELIEELKSITANLRTALEALLEDSDDEAEEKNKIAESLEELVNMFTVLNWDKAVEYTNQALEAVPALSAFGEDDAEKKLLRYCLVLEEALESHEDLEFITESNIIGQYEIENDSANDEINVALLKVLRTLYQKQLLLLIKNSDKTIPLNAINALSRDIAVVLPKMNSRDWLLLSFYVQALLEHQKNLDVETHRLLANLDLRLSALISKSDANVDIYPDLLKTIETLPNGSVFIENNILTQDTYSITPLVYKKFGVALKDELVKIHEQLERIYLDPSQRLRLNETFPFLEKLQSILDFMGLKRLALLIDIVLSDFKELNEHPVADEKFNEIVSEFWVLESFLSNLWLRKDQVVPLSYHEAQNWAYASAKQTALKLFTEEYRKIREVVTNTTDSAELLELQQRLFKNVKAEKILSISYGLTKYFVDNFMSQALSKEELLEVTLAIEYISNMNFENREVVDDVVHSAQEILQKHINNINASSVNEEVQKFDADVIEAFTSDLNDLEYELNVLMDQGIEEKNNYDDLIRIVHTLRGNAEIVHLTNVSKLAAILENNMRSNTSYNRDVIELYYKSVLNIIEQFKAFLAQN